MDGFDRSLTFNEEEFDLFGSGGAMELELELELERDMMSEVNFGMSNLNLSFGVSDGGAHYKHMLNDPRSFVEHPYGEYPSRTLFVRNITNGVNDSELQTLFEQYGDIRSLYSACKHRGFVMISYYDIRAAQTALRALQNKPLRKRKLDIHYSIPKDYPSDEEINQGTLVVFNLDPSVSSEDLLQIFGAYGEVKEIRETPNKKRHRFVEYYDVRDAEAALKSLNNCDIAGKRISLEVSRPGGIRRNLMLQLAELSQGFDQYDTSIGLQVGPSIASSPPSVLTKSPVFNSMSPNTTPGLALLGNDHKSGQLNGPGFGTTGSTTPPYETLSGPQFLWGSPGSHSHGFPTSTGKSPTTARPFTGLLGPFPGYRHARSAPSGLPFDQHCGWNHDPFDHHARSAPSLLNSCGCLNIKESGPLSFSDMSPRTGRMFLESMNLDSMTERARTRLVDRNANQPRNNKQFELDLDKISRGEDTRTTLMIKNIPNRYTSEMLLAAIDDDHRGTYDFLYLPIDFKRECNVGYAFINMVSPMHIIPFYQNFHGRKWERFYSEKVASLAYARIQGKAALLTHFRYSNLMYEDKRCWPIFFNLIEEGSDAAVDQGYLPYASLNTSLDDGDCEGCNGSVSFVLRSC